MNNFVQYTPTRIIFGKDTEKEVGPQIKKRAALRSLSSMEEAAL